jgi:DNA-binding transcriptional ArsR family regulator
MAKIEIDIKKLEKAAARMKAMAHPTRLRILSLLDSEVELCVTDICNKLKTDQATVSIHLKVLNTQCILNQRKEGKQVFYSLHNKNIQNTLALIDKY